MPRSLMLSAARRPMSPLQMQFVAPLRTAKAWHAEDAAGWSASVPLSHLVTVAILVFAWGGMALWRFA